MASENGATVPEDVLARAAEELEPTERKNLADLKPCCRQRVLTAQLATTCNRKSSCQPKPTADVSLLPGVIAMHAQRCQGNSLSLSLIPPSIPTDEIGTKLPLLPLESVFLSESLLYQPPSFDAVLPPPEFAVL